MRKIKRFEIVSFGVDHAQYFQGAGVSGTDWDNVAIGAGDNAKDAYNDAVESLAQSGYDVSTLPTRPRGIRQSDSVDAELRRHGESTDIPDDSELYAYVAIYVEDGAERPAPTCAKCGEYWPCSVVQSRGAYRPDIVAEHGPA